MLDYCIQFQIFRVHLLPLLAPVRACTCARLNTTITQLHPVLVAIGRSSQLGARQEPLPVSLQFGLSPPKLSRTGQLAVLIQPTSLLA
jgi:hypothetical protein